jgi:hypothetical protein
MKMRWHTPKRSGGPSGSPSPSRRTGQPRKVPIPASTDFNTGGSDPEDRKDDFDPALDCDDPVYSFASWQGDAVGGGERRVLIGKIAPGWQIKFPLLIRIERDSDGSFVASDDIFAVHGDGPTLHRAVKDYAVSLVEYYRLLEARVANDEPTMALFRRLQHYLGPAEE